MRVVITRPAGDAHAWVEALQGAGHATLALALIDVGPATQPQPLAQAWAQWPNYQSVMFVSAQAVRYFFERQPDNLSWTHGPRCWATGPGTHKALLQAGVPEACIDSPAAEAAQFDSEALWQRVSAQVQPGKPVLIVRGHDVNGVNDVNDEAAKLSDASSIAASNKAQVGTGRDWLAQQLQAAGAPVQFVVAYERRVPVWSAQQHAQAAQAATDNSVWCFSSSQAIQNLAHHLPMQSWAQARCVATHPRIAQAAHAVGFGEVHLSKPSLADVLVSLESLA
jgi:uroporphyrinogen-III synthase